MVEGLNIHCGAHHSNAIRTTTKPTHAELGHNHNALSLTLPSHPSISALSSPQTTLKHGLEVNLLFPIFRRGDIAQGSAIRRLQKCRTAIHAWHDTRGAGAEACSRGGAPEPVTQAYEHGYVSCADRASMGILTAVDEPRTSFSDDMGKAFDDIGMAASTPLPASVPVTPQKPRPQPSTNGAHDTSSLGKGASALGKDASKPGKDVFTADKEAGPLTSEAGLAAPAAGGSKTPSVRQVSNPVKDVTSADLDGTPVFFIDDGAVLLDEVAVVGVAEVGPIDASADSRNQPLDESQQLTSSAPHRASQLPLSEQTREDSQRASEQSHASSQQLSTEQRELSPQLSSDPSPRSTFGASGVSSSGYPIGGFPSTPPLEGSRDRGSFAEHADIYGAAGVAPSASPSGAGGGTAVAAASMLGGTAAATAAAVGLSGKEAEKEATPEVGDSSVGEQDSVGGAQIFTAAHEATPPSFSDRAPPITTEAGEQTALATQPTFGAAVPDNSSALERPASAVPDDMDPTCLPEQNMEASRELSSAATPEVREQSSPTASAVPDDFDTTCVADPAGGASDSHLRHSNSVDSIPRINEAGAAPTSDLDTEGNPAGIVRETDHEEATGSPVLGASGHPVELAPTTELLGSARPSLSSDTVDEGGASHGVPAVSFAVGGAALGAAGGAPAAGMANLAMASPIRTMPEDRSMSAASVTAIKDGRVGIPKVKTTNLVCEAAPKSGDTFGTNDSLGANDSPAPSESSHLVTDTRHANDPAASTASITAIRGGNEGQPPSPVGRSPLSESRTVDEHEFMDTESEPTESRQREGVGAGAAAGAAGLAAAAGGAALAGSHAHDRRETGRGDALAPTEHETSSAPVTRTDDRFQDADVDATEKLASAADTEGQLPTPQRQGTDGSATSAPDDGAPFHTATTTSANESFISATPGGSDATPLPRSETPRAPGDYMSAVNAGGHAEERRVDAHSDHGAYVNESEPGSAEAGTLAPTAEAAMPTSHSDANDTRDAGETSSSKVPAAASWSAVTPAAATSSTEKHEAAGTLPATEPTSTTPAAAATGTGAATTSAPAIKGANGADTTAKATEPKPVPKETATKKPGPSAPAPSKSATSGHTRSDSKSSTGSARRKVGFMSKIKGEMKVISGKLKHDNKMVAEGERMKQGQ